MTKCRRRLRGTNIGVTFMLLSACLASSLAAGQTRSLTETGQVDPPNDRFHVQEENGVRVTSAVPSAIETIKLFDVGLYARNIQPVWVRVENLTDKELWFLPTGIDEAYYTPIETSYRRQNRIPLLDWGINRDYFSMRMSLRIGPREVRSGYVFTRVDQGTKSFNVDVVGRDEQFRMSFFVPVPGLKLDHYEVALSLIHI